MSQFKVGDKAEFIPVGVCHYAGSFTPGKIYEYIINRYTQPDVFTCLNDYGREDGLGSKHFKLLNSSSQSVQKYQIGDKFYNAIGDTLEIVGYDDTQLEPYRIISGTTGNTFTTTEIFIDMNYIKVNYVSNPITYINNPWDRSGIFDFQLPKPFVINLKSPECDCGGDKTYGANSSAMEHSSWCSKFKDKA